MHATLSIQPDETALSLLRRVRFAPIRTGIAFLDDAPLTMGGGSPSLPRASGVYSGDVFELYGPSDSAKSEVIVNVVVRSILSRDLGGEERQAYIFDNDSRLSILRIEHLVRQRITS
ncbi:unnamed protein product, partial [Phaeothamnion confervicola]